MDFITIFEALLRWGTLALVGGIIAGCILACGYLLYKKVLKGRGEITRLQAVCAGLLCYWLLLVLGLTSLSRGANFTGSFNIDFLSGYISAWNNWSISELQLILFNILMFVPLGFLLPLVWKRAEQFRITALVSLAVTGSIEVFQFLTGTGIFELDDLFHNLLGSLFGYFCLMALLSLWRERAFRFAPIAKAFLIPAVIGLAVGSAFVLYACQPYGNMSILPAVKQDMSGVQIEANWTSFQSPAAASVYRNRYASDKDNLEQIKDGLKDLEGLTFRGSARREDENLGYMGTDANGTEFRLLFFFRTGEWNYTTFADSETLSEQAVQELRSRYESWMQQQGLLPEQAEFSVQNGNILRWDVPDTQNLATGTDSFQEGSVMLQFDASGTLSDFFYQITWNEYVATQLLLTKDEAFKQVQAGNFQQYVPFQPGDVLYVNECNLDYIYDTKGFYQPVYQFSGYINEPDNMWVCSIPAIAS